MVMLMADVGYERLLREACADSAVLAVALTGLHALGPATSANDDVFAASGDDVGWMLTYHPT
jgi:hypothetical protein